VPAPILYLLLVLLYADAPQMAKRGFELLQKGELKAAEAELRQAVKLAPGDPVALAILGMVLSGQSNFEEASVYFERALRIDPDDTRTRYNLAVTELRLGKTAAAKANLERILNQKPDHKQAAALLGTTKVPSYEAALEHYQGGRFAESQKVLEGLIGGGIREAKVFSLLAWCHHRQNRPSEALATIRRAIETAPSEAAWYNHAAQMMLEYGEVEAAFRTATKALEIDSKSVQALKLKGRIELERGGSRQAAETIRACRGPGAFRPRGAVISGHIATDAVAACGRGVHVRKSDLEVSGIRTSVRSLRQAPARAGGSRLRSAGRRNARKGAGAR
jgi:tetratricopeptide (TPR) repeat protein